MNDHDDELRRLVGAPSAGPEPIELISARAQTRRRRHRVGAGIGLGSVVALMAFAVVSLPDDEPVVVQYGVAPTALTASTASTATTDGTVAPVADPVSGDCGTAEIGYPDDAGYYIAYPPFDCILAAFEAGRPAILTHLLATVEGDPIVNRLVIDELGDLTVFVDTTADQFGPQVITELHCTELYLVDVDLVWDGCTEIQSWDPETEDPIPSTSVVGDDPLTTTSVMEVATTPPPTSMAPTTPPPG